MSQTWKDFFYFNKRERNGALVMASLMSFVLTVKAVNRTYLPFHKEPKKEWIETGVIQKETHIKKEDVQKEFVKPTIQKLELNKVDTAQLVQLKGVGSYYARQIVSYREHLGGFCNKEQLFEIPNMREETVLKIWDQLTLDTSLVRKISLNSAERIDLVMHPYITWEMANRIYEERRYGSLYESPSDLVTRKILTQELFDKLQPYLSL